MAVIDVLLNDTFATWRTKSNSAFTRVGDTAVALTTTATDLTGAINEIDAAIDPSGLTTTDQSSLVAGINELDGEIGDLTTLLTTDKTSIVNAVNENKGFSIAMAVAL